MVWRPDEPDRASTVADPALGPSVPTGALGVVAGVLPGGDATYGPVEQPVTEQQATRVCHICGGTVPLEAYCQACEEAFLKRRLIGQMGVPERLIELREWLEGPTEIHYMLIHKRIEELMGRPVWTHEIAYPESLYAELCSGGQPSMEEIIGKLPAHMPVIVVGIRQ